MTKLIIDIDDKIRHKDDVLIFNGKNYQPISKGAFLRELIIRCDYLDHCLDVALSRIDELERQLRIDHGIDPMEQEIVQEPVQEEVVNNVIEQPELVFEPVEEPAETEEVEENELGTN